MKFRILAILAVVPVLMSVTFPALTKKSNDLTPATTLVAVDFHDVVAKPRKFERFKIIFGNLGKLLKNKKELKKIKDDPAQSEQMFADNPDLAQVKDTLKDIITAYKPNKKTVKVLQDLKNKGYKLVLFSNIMPYCYQEICNDPKFKPVLELFDDIHIGLSKPHAHTYTKFLNTVNPFGLWNTVLIDDQKTNVAGAVENGFTVALQFKKAKQLQTDLENLQVL